MADEDFQKAKAELAAALDARLGNLVNDIADRILNAPLVKSQNDGQAYSLSAFISSIDAHVTADAIGNAVKDVQLVSQNDGQPYSLEAFVSSIDLHTTAKLPKGE